MFFCNICGFDIQINNKYRLIEDLSRGYGLKEAVPEFIMQASAHEIECERKKYPEYGDDYHEAIVLFRKICKELLPKDIFFLHSAVVKYNGYGYVFAGKSGVGKSTHASLWQRYFPGAEVINGDKPLIKYENNGFFAYGTPWCGKEMLQKNTKAEICGVCFIEQSQKNSISEMNSSEIISRIFDQTVYMKEPELNEKFMDLINKFVSDIPFYLLKCNISEEAAVLAYNKMKPEGR